MDEEKVATLGLPDQGMFLSTPSPLFSFRELSEALPNIENHVVINQKLSGFVMHFPFQRVVPVVMDRAIKEILFGIVHRSVCIACQTTKQLVLKNYYALEPDESRIYDAAHLMVASLAGSVTHMTCKEPLRISISRHLRHSLQGLSISNDVLEQIVQLVTNDNLYLCCAAVELVAKEKAIQTIYADIAQQLSLRRKHREDAESLRPKPGHCPCLASEYPKFA